MPSARSTALNLLVASLLISGALGIAALLVKEFGTLQARVLLTSLTVSAASILALASATALERRRYRTLAKSGIAVTAVAAVCILIIIWFDPRDDDFIRLVGSVATIAIALAHCSLLSLATLAPRHEWVQRAAFASAGLLASLLVIFYWTEFDEEWYLRILGIASIVVTVLTILVPVMHKIAGGEAAGIRSVPPPVNLADVFGDINEYWSPRVIASLNSGHVVRAARVKGTFPMHSHADQDEFFFVVSGRLDIAFADNTVGLAEGEGLLVPAGVEHAPSSADGAEILLFEPESTVPTGN